MIYNLSLIVLIAVTVWAMLTPKVKDKPGIIVALVFVALPTALVLATVQYAFGVDWSQSISFLTVPSAPLY